MFSHFCIFVVSSLTCSIVIVTKKSKYGNRIGVGIPEGKGDASKDDERDNVLLIMEILVKNAKYYIA